MLGKGEEDARVFEAWLGISTEAKVVARLVVEDPVAVAHLF